MANRDDTPNGQAVSLSKGQLIRLGAEPGGLVPVEGPSHRRPARRTKASGDPMDASAALGALTTALRRLAASSNGSGPGPTRRRRRWRRPV